MTTRVPTNSTVHCKGWKLNPLRHSSMTTRVPTNGSCNLSKGTNNVLPMVLQQGALYGLDLNHTSKTTRVPTNGSCNPTNGKAALLQSTDSMVHRKTHVW